MKSIHPLTVSSLGNTILDLLSFLCVLNVFPVLSVGVMYAIRVGRGHAFRAPYDGEGEYGNYRLQHTLLTYSVKGVFLLAISVAGSLHSYSHIKHLNFILSVIISNGTQSA